MILSPRCVNCHPAGDRPAAGRRRSPAPAAGRARRSMASAPSACAARPATARRTSIRAACRAIRRGISRPWRWRGSASRLGRSASRSRTRSATAACRLRSSSTTWREDRARRLGLASRGRPHARARNAERVRRADQGLGGQRRRLPGILTPRPLQGRCDMNFVATKEIAAHGPAAPVRDPIEVARAWLDEHGKVALATVVSTWGSAPVPVGGQLVVGPEERFQGSVSGGCVEGDVIAEAADVMAGGRPRLMEFGVAEETAWRAGLPCGGTIKVLLEPLGARSRCGPSRSACWRRGSARTALVVTTNVDHRHAAAVRAGSPGCRPRSPTVCKAARAASSSTEEGSVFVQALLPPVRLIIAGGTNIGQVLADLGRQVGYDVIVVDPRAAFVTEERFGATSKPHRMARGLAQFPGARCAHRRGRADACGPHRRRGAARGAALGLPLYRRARLQDDARQAHRSPKGGRFRR